MKKSTSKILKGLITCLLMLYWQFSFGQVIFTSVPDSIAALNVAYNYAVATTYAPDAPTYSLQTAPAWMSINPTSGLVTGTPTLMSSGGKVMIKAHNSMGDYFQTFNIYITDEVVCDPSIVAYWPMDYKVGNKLPDFAGGHDADWNGPTQPEPTISSNAVAGNSILFAPTNADDEFYDVLDQEPFQFHADDDFSVSFWFKNTDPLYSTGYFGEVLLGRNTDTDVARWYINWDPTTARLQFHMEDISSDDTLLVHPTVLDDTLWHHVVATFNSVAAAEQKSYMWLWVDKTSKYVAFDFYKDDFYGNGEFNMGWLYNWGRAYSGYLDEVAYYNKELTPADVTELYNKGIAHQSVCSPGNIAPIILSSAVTTGTQDIAYSYQFQYREIDGDPITLSAPVLPSWLSFNTSTGLLSGTPTNDDVDTNRVILRVSDGQVNVDQEFVITVANVNDLPVISSTPATSVDEDDPYTYTLTASDIDPGATLTYSAPVLPAWMDFNTSTHVLSGTPTNDQVGTADSANFNVTLRVTDNVGGYVEQPFVITVKQVNDAPVINSQNAVSTDEDVSITVTLADLNVVDVDNTYPDDFTLTVKDGSNYTHSGNAITPVENYNGTLTVPLDLSDGTATVSYSLSVTVNAINDAPVFTSTPVASAQTGVAYEYWIATSDVEAQQLTLTCPTIPAWLNFTSSLGNGLLTGTPSNPGVYSVVLSVTDGLAVTEQPFTITTTGSSAIDDAVVEFVRIFPNPASDYVEFQFENVLNKASLAILSIDGRLIKEVHLENLKSFTLDISDLRNSVYFYRIIADDGEQMGKLLIKQ
ncbi:MAG: putative Ig domain-containing protein [Bacteroidales bacterium]|nr:putative Ig domain-containing protein [Bacteroidales bacterium]